MKKYRVHMVVDVVVTEKECIKRSNDVLEKGFTDADLFQVIDEDPAAFLNDWTSEGRTVTDHAVVTVEEVLDVPL